MRAQLWLTVTAGQQGNENTNPWLSEGKRLRPKEDGSPLGLCLIAAWVGQERGLRGRTRPTVLSHVCLCEPQRGHRCSLDTVLRPYKFCTSDWSSFSVSSDWLALCFDLNSSCLTPLKHFNQPDCCNHNLHTTQESDAHRCESQRSATSPTLNSKVTYQPRFFLTATCPSLDRMPVKKQKCYEMKFIAPKGIAHKLSSPLTFCMSNFCSFVFSHTRCPETVT